MNTETTRRILSFITIMIMMTNSVCLASMTSVDSTDERNIIIFDDVEIKASSDQIILKKTAANLPRKSNTLKNITFGLGQHTQIVECNGSTVQLSRYFGTFVTSDAMFSRLYTTNIHYLLRFFPVLNASSLRLDASGKEVMNTDYMIYNYWINNAPERCFDTYNKYVFDLMCCIYLSGPLYSGNLKDYDFHFEGSDGTLYTYSFESSKRYPKRNLLYAKGALVVDAETFTLKSMKVDNIGVHNMTTKVRGIKYSDATTKDYLDTELLIDDKGAIEYILTHLEWDNEIITSMTTSDRYVLPPGRYAAVLQNAGRLKML